MGIKKLVTITVEAQIEIELPDLLANPTKEDIEGINYCGFEVEEPNDVYREAARLILLGMDDCNNDVFGVLHRSWRKGSIKNPERECFFDLRDLYIEDYEVENL
ncbi:hypothetical protein [Acinetobacter bereziniae]|uniref:hypothetical protein n=1 Tax=Acinetobacter bereziniae TaxID=106648 RepID=UPI0018FF4060|nr:hypothetical protein [Acinetobacter bereziniae]MBJ8477206.1 hypothetical protein [Acinetobacter bereziniae]